MPLTADELRRFAKMLDEDFNGNRALVAYELARITASLLYPLAHLQEGK